MSAEGPLRDGRIAGHALFETMRWEPGRGLIRKDLHLARLARSAAALGFVHDPRRILECLEAIDHVGHMLRVRLTLHTDGSCELTQGTFEPHPEGTVWKLAIARNRIDADEPLIRHKTTRRDTYEAARAEFSPQEADEVILLNAHDMVCEGTISNVFLRGPQGMLLTPPLSAGLLPGVLRAQLLAERKARETRITRAELDSAEILVGNSLRGLIPAKLAETGT